MSSFKKYRYHRAVSPALITALGFVAIIMFGAALLMTPIASADRVWTSPLDAVFTATSATCVTGLVTLDTASHFSIFGQCVILFLIQIGGLGFMSMAVLLSTIIRRTISPKERVIIAQAYGLETGGGTVRLMRKILMGTLLFEASGAVILSLRLFLSYGFSPAESIYKGIFVSVSAFCNAGFDPFGTKETPFISLTGFDKDPIVLLTLAALIIIGGIGFIVWDDIHNIIRKKKRLGVYPKFILVITAFLLISGTVIFSLLEWNNPKTLGGYSSGYKILNAFFQSVTLRTAGFNTLNISAFGESGAFISILYMIIGGASGSTAGGIKVGTIGILFIAAFCAATGKPRVTVYGRKISREIILRALSVMLMAILLIFTAGIAINLIDGAPLLQSMYEAASAYATVGVSMAGTPTLSAASHIIIILLMYLGRVGILTVTFAVAMKTHDEYLLDYPNINMPIG